MAKLHSRTISKRTVEALRADRDMVVWDSELPGFGVRVYPSGAKVYVAQTRGRGKSKRVAVGRHGVLTAEQARQRAALIIARVKAGEDPIPAPLAQKPEPGPTVADLAGRYMREHLAVRCKPATAETARTAMERHIVPALGRLTLAAVEGEQVMRLHGGLSATPAMANLAVDTLSRMFTMAEAWGMVPDGANPCGVVTRYKARKRERFLTDAEFRRLGRVLAGAVAEGGVSAHAVAALRLLMVTGCRCNEILTLRWEDVDFGANEIRLRDSKTGPRGAAAAAAGGEGAGGARAGARQPVGHCRAHQGHAHAQSERAVGDRSEPGGTGRCADSRSSSFVCVAGAGARREPGDDREVARTRAGADNGALCPSGARFGEGLRGPDRGQHRRGHSGRARAAGVGGVVTEMPKSALRQTCRHPDYAALAAQAVDSSGCHSGDIGIFTGLINS